MNTVTKEIIRENFPDQPVKVEETKIKQESGCTKVQMVFTNEVTHEQTVATVVTGSQGTVIEEVKPHIAVRPAVMPIMEPIMKPAVMPIQEHVTIVSCFEGVEEQFVNEFPEERQEQIKELGNFLENNNIVIEEEIETPSPAK